MDGEPLDILLVEDNEAHADIFRDYFTSHPPMRIRVDQFNSAAESWWILNKSEIRYSGELNYNAKVPVFKKILDDGSS